MNAQKTIPIESLITTVGALCVAIGPAVLAYFLSSFTVDKSGYYYNDMEWGIALGVLLISAGRVLRSWPRG